MKTLTIIGKWLAMTLAYAFIWACSMMLFDLIWSGGITSGDSTEGSPLSFVLVSALNMMVITWYLLRTRHNTLISRIITTALLLFTIQFFLTQIESWWFGSSLNMSGKDILIILAAGLSTSVLIAAFGCLLFPSKDFTVTAERKPAPVRSQIFLYVLLALLVYPLIYFLFGYFIAWQFEDLRLFYTGSATKGTFLDQLSGGFTSGLYAFQILRGFVWIAMAWVIIRYTRCGNLEQALLTGTMFAVLACSQLLMANPLMPESIRMIHLIETGSSTFLWGAIIVAAPHFFSKSGRHLAAA